jgi:addiction module HigA family antidote
MSGIQAADPLPLHPGKILLTRDFFLTSRLSIAEICRRLGISRQALYNILEAKNGVSPIMALKLARLCGTAPEFWLDCQARYDLAVAAQRYAAEIEAVPPFQIGAP